MCLSNEFKATSAAACETSSEQTKAAMLHNQQSDLVGDDFADMPIIDLNLFLQAGDENLSAEA